MRLRRKPPQSKFEQMVNDPDKYFKRAYKEASKIVDRQVRRESQQAAQQARERKKQNHDSSKN